MTSVPSGRNPTMTPAQKHSQFSSLHGQFREVLANAQKERQFRPDFVEVTIRGHKYQEPAWAVFEMETMLGAVNKIRTSEGKPEATMDDLWRVEGTAKGHSDYSTKFALYCVELALYGKELVAP